MAYNKTVCKTIGFKTRDLELAIFPGSQNANVKWRNYWIKLVIIIITYLLKHCVTNRLSPVMQVRYVRNF